MEGGNKRRKVEKSGKIYFVEEGESKKGEGRESEEERERNGRLGGGRGGEQGGREI